MNSEQNSVGILDKKPNQNAYKPLFFLVLIIRFFFSCSVFDAKYFIQKLRSLRQINKLFIKNFFFFLCVCSFSGQNRLKLYDN